MDNESDAWGAHYDHARNRLGYEPGEAWAYADRKVQAA